AEVRGYRARRRLTSSVPVIPVLDGRGAGAPGQEAFNFLRPRYSFNFLRPSYGGRGIIGTSPSELPTLGQPSSVADGPGVPARHGDRGTVDQALPAGRGAGLPACGHGDRPAVAGPDPRHLRRGE